jgi:hypothetical protein
VTRGSETRQRQKTLSARFNEQEAEAIRQLADRAGVPVASFIRSATLNRPLPAAARRPTVSQEVAARLLGELGRVAESLRAVAAAGQLDLADPRLSAALRDLADMRAVCFQAMGRQP